MIDPHPQQTIRELVPQLKQKTIDAFNASEKDEFGAPPSLKGAGEIFARIDRAAAPWLGDIPDPKEIRTLVVSVRTATLALSQGPISVNGESLPGGAIGGFLTAIEAACEEMSGDTIEAYKAKFLLRMRSVLVNLAGMTVPIGGALAAEEQLWYWALQDARNAVAKAVAGMEAIIRGDGFDWHLLLEVVGWALEGAELFTGPLGKTATALGGIGVRVLAGTAAKPTEAANKPANKSWEDVLTAFEDSMAKINERLTGEEQSLQANIDQNAQNMRTFRSHYDLVNDNPATQDVVEEGDHPDLGIKDAHDFAKQIHIDGHLVDGIISTHMPALAGKLGEAVEGLNGGYETGQLDRPAGLGNGAGIWINSLILQLVQSVKDLQWEVEQGRTTLRIAVQGLKDADDRTQEALDAHRKRFGKGSGYEPSQRWVRS